MAKATKSATTQTSIVGFSSIKDAGFQQAGAYQTTENIARYVVSQDASFPETVSDEVRDALYEGYRLKFAQLEPAKTYAVINDHYVLATPEHESSASVEKISIGVEYGYSFSQQEFGKLKNTKPALHALIKDVREKTQNYCSNRLGDLKRTAKKILALQKGETVGTRSANKDFAEFVDTWFNDLALTKLKTAKSRGDSTADEKRFNAAKVAFMTKWIHSDAK